MSTKFREGDRVRIDGFECMLHTLVDGRLRASRCDNGEGWWCFAADGSTDIASRATLIHRPHGEGCVGLHFRAGNGGLRVAVRLDDGMYETRLAGSEGDAAWYTSAEIDARGGWLYDYEPPAESAEPDPHVALAERRLAERIEASPLPKWLKGSDLTHERFIEALRYAGEMEERLRGAPPAPMVVHPLHRGGYPDTVKRITGERGNPPTIETEPTPVPTYNGVRGDLRCGIGEAFDDLGVDTDRHDLRCGRDAIETDPGEWTELPLTYSATIEEWACMLGVKPDPLPTVTITLTNPKPACDYCHGSGVGVLGLQCPREGCAHR